MACGSDAASPLTAEGCLGPPTVAACRRPQGTVTADAGCVRRVSDGQRFLATHGGWPGVEVSRIARVTSTPWSPVRARARPDRRGAQARRLMRRGRGDRGRREARDPRPVASHRGRPTLSSPVRLRRHRAAQSLTDSSRCSLPCPRAPACSQAAAGSSQCTRSLQCRGDSNRIRPCSWNACTGCLRRRRFRSPSTGSTALDNSRSRRPSSADSQAHSSTARRHRSAN